MKNIPDDGYWHCRKAFGNLQNVVIPKMFINLTSERVLIMEWIEVGLWPLLRVNYHHTQPVGLIFIIFVAGAETV